MGLTPDQRANEPVFMSAPSSPKRINMESWCFFSVPTSPTKRSTIKAAAGYDLETEPTTPKSSAFEDSISSVDADEFEFETSRRFNVECEAYGEVEGANKDAHNKYYQYDGPKESLPAIAFADELFSDGKVMPLKPPPRLQYPNYDKKFEKQSSTLSSPKSPRSPLRLPFQRRSLWNDDFDPFMVALENVKEEKKVAKNHRRSRSMSPFREIRPDGTNDLSGSNLQQINQMGLILPTQRSESNLDKKLESSESAFWMWIADQNRQMGHREQVKQEKKRPIKLAEPKGVLFARKARLVKMGLENPRNPSLMEAGESANEAGAACIKGTKSQRFKKFLLRSASLRKISNEDKPMSSNGTESKSKIARKFSFKSMRLTQYNYNEEKRVSEVTRMTLVQYRPKLLLCMGYGTKNVR